MIKINPNYLKLQGSYLFAEVARYVKEYQIKNPDKKVIRLGIGDVTQPLTLSVIKGLSEGVSEMSKKETFQGYPPYEGFEFVREKIANVDFKSRGVDISKDEIFISTGAKEDTANFQELFSNEIKIAITDPVYPVYLDTNVMTGRTGNFKDGKFEGVTYLDCNESNNFKPAIPNEKVDLIYLCFPNNPTGQTATKEELTKWVNYAKTNKALILFDAAYEAYIREDGIPHSIFEIEGAKEVAVEFRSLSKTAGFTGTRFAYTIIPNTVKIYDDAGNEHQLNKLWLRRQATKFNGVSYIIQKGADRVFTPEGQAEVRGLVDYYLSNAKIIQSGLDKLGIKYSGGKNSPYIWLKTPNNLSSWDFFHKLLNEANVVGTPGVGFGRCGEGYFRLTAFGAKEQVEEAVQRLNQLKF
ncbi:MAG TPA: LL-diaminopimelate aminotransferase [Spirochaetota bacterium]|nr:LL-diaminopimelate aminotransferase [Spirochaetota bacterium]